MKKILILIVKIYQKFLSPLCPGVCRYKPTCSQYMIEAITAHGVIKGTFMGVKRICRCHPWGGHGYDPVPQKEIKHK